MKKTIIRYVVVSRHTCFASPMTDGNQAAYIFNPIEDAEHGSRPSKRRRVSGTAESAGTTPDDVSSGFEPLFKGAEKAECVRRRKELFETSWAPIENRIQVRRRRPVRGPVRQNIAHTSPHSES